MASDPTSHTFPAEESIIIDSASALPQNYLDSQRPNSASFLETINSYTGWPIVIGTGIIYFSYYLVYMVKRPTLVGNSKFVSFIKEFCPALTEKYWPTFWCFEARTQTILGSILKRAANIRYTREYLELKDGGCIGLDWCYNNENTKYSDEERPTVVFLPGIVGHSDANYARNFSKIVIKQGFRSVVFNYRGNGGVTLKTPKTYCAAKTDDLEYVIKHISEKFPNAPLLGTGISMGGLKLINYLSKSGSDTPLCGAMVISIPYEVFESSKTLEQPLNSLLFNRMLTNIMIERLKSYETMFRNSTEIDFDNALKSRTIRQFDENFTSKLFGYSSLADYYKDANINQKLHKVKVPVLALNAADDPFSPEHALPFKEVSESSSMVLAVTPYGGHIGFLDGLFPRYHTYMDKVFKQFVVAIFKHRQVLKEVRLM